MYNTGPFFEEDGVELEGSINYHHKKQTPLMTRNPRKVLTSILTFSIFNILIGAGVMGTQIGAMVLFLEKNVQSSTASYYDKIASGIWAGTICMITGAIGCAASATNRNKPVLVTTAVFSTFSLVCAFSSLCLAGMSIIKGTNKTECIYNLVEDHCSSWLQLQWSMFGCSCGAVVNNIIVLGIVSAHSALYQPRHRKLTPYPSRDIASHQPSKTVSKTSFDHPQSPMPTVHPSRIQNRSQKSVVIFTPKSPSVQMASNRIPSTDDSITNNPRLNDKVIDGAENLTQKQSPMGVQQALIQKALMELHQNSKMKTSLTPRDQEDSRSEIEVDNKENSSEEGSNFKINKSLGNGKEEEMDSKIIASRNDKSPNHAERQKEGGSSSSIDEDQSNHDKNSDDSSEKSNIFEDERPNRDVHP